MCVLIHLNRESPVLYFFQVFIYQAALWHRCCLLHLCLLQVDVNFRSQCEALTLKAKRLCQIKCGKEDIRILQASIGNVSAHSFLYSCLSAGSYIYACSLFASLEIYKLYLYLSVWQMYCLIHQRRILSGEF